MLKDTELVEHPKGFLILKERNKAPTIQTGLGVEFYGHKLLSPSALEDHYTDESKEKMKKMKKMKSRLRETKASSHRTDNVIKLFFTPPFSPSDDTLCDVRYRDQSFVRDSALSPLYFWPFLPVSNSEYKQLSTPSPQNIKTVIMVNCLFGASILGYDKYNKSYPLIDHTLDLDAKIEKIKVRKQAHPYEMMMLASFMHLTRAIKQFGKPAPVVHYHLPVVDYMLYGLNLFLKGRMTCPAFNEYVEQVKIRGVFFNRAIEKISAEQGVKVIIESPFDNLFGPKKDITANFLLRHFDDLTNTKICLSRKEIIESFAKKLAGYLKINSYVPAHKAAWDKILTDETISAITSLNELTHLANAAMIAFATSKNGIRDFEVCSLLPIDEKPIAHHYNKTFATQFKKILCLFWAPPVLSYINFDNDDKTPNKSNNLFRFRPDRSNVDYKALMQCIERLMFSGEFQKNQLKDIIKDAFSYSHKNKSKHQAQKPPVYQRATNSSSFLFSTLLISTLAVILARALGASNVRDLVICFAVIATLCTLLKTNMNLTESKEALNQTNTFLAELQSKPTLKRDESFSNLLIGVGSRYNAPSLSPLRLY